MKNHFAWAAGSIPGRDHVGTGRLLVGKNNQDAWRIAAGTDWLAAVVCDGCGSGKYSECGANWGAALFASELKHRLLNSNIPRPTDAQTARLWVEAVSEQVVRSLRRMAAELGEPLAEVMHDYFLFTVLLAVVTEENTWLAALGDGVWMVNGVCHTLGPFPGNAPPYVGYRMMTDEGQTPWLILDFLSTQSLQTLLLASDGAEDLLNAEESFVPGKRELVGSFDQWWCDDRLFRNADAVRRRLALLNTEHHGVEPNTGTFQRTPGLLRDDTTLVVLRRKSQTTDINE